jgi:hypothetical protein
MKDCGENPLLDRKAAMKCKLLPIFKGDSPDGPDPGVLKFIVLLRSEEVAALLRISRRCVHRLREAWTLQQVKVGKLTRVSSHSLLQLLPEEPQSTT